MERLNWHIADELAKQAEVRVIAPSGSGAIKPPAVALKEAPLKPLPLFLVVAFIKALWLAIRWRPSVVLAGSGLTAPLAWMVGRCSGARTAAYLHGLDITVNNRTYQNLWVPVFKKLDSVIVNSTPTQHLALAVGVAEATTYIVHPGVSLITTPQTAAALQTFRQQHGLGDARILLSVGRLAERKGLREFVQYALPTIVKAAPDTLLVVIGDAPADALLARQQKRSSIEAVAQAAGIGEHLRFLGRSDEQTLACAYECANLHVFPVRDIPGDPEGFGMVAIEAAAHGVPTVAFATGGVVDAVAQGQSGYLVTPGDYGALAQSVLQTLSDGTDMWRIKAAAFAQGFAWSLVGQRMRAVLITDSQ
jgi:phosphatidylinositol alpha-1,6-mannosyltransferase